MTKEMVLRGDIRICNFGIPKGHTIAKRRPVVIIQNNVANEKSQTTIVAVIRSNPRVGELPIGVKLEPGITGLEHVSYVDMGHIYTVDKYMLSDRIGTVIPADMKRIDRAIDISLGKTEYPL